MRVRGAALVRFHAPRSLMIGSVIATVVAFVVLRLPISLLPLLYVPLVVPPLSRARIRQWVRRLDRPQRSIAERALVVAARRPWFSRGDRLDGLGHLLLVRLERGDLDDAVELVELRPRDADRGKRARTSEHGYLALRLHQRRQVGSRSRTPEEETSRARVRGRMSRRAGALPSTARLGPSSTGPSTPMGSSSELERLERQGGLPGFDPRVP